MIVSMSILCKGYNSLIPTFKGFIIVALVAVASHLKFSSQCISTVDWRVWLFGTKERQDKKIWRHQENMGCGGELLFTIIHNKVKFKHHFLM